jgi:RHS repeat-associated protein
MQYEATDHIKSSVLMQSYTDTMGENFSSATYYSYDIAGNVDTLIQDFGINGATTNNIMNIHSANSNRWKRMVYRYDLISGKVNFVAYQPSRNGAYYPDMLYHRYSYDAENRLTLAETSADSVIWEKDARYDYYLHGPLARTTIGDQLVQGTDYAYTLQGWLKGVNAINLSSADYDMGTDGKAGSVNQYTARDAYGFNLNYFNGDLKYIKSGVAPFPYLDAAVAENRPLYNGNINSMAVSINYPGGASAPQLPQLYHYSYDQLNRITGMDVYRNASLSTNNNWTGMSLVNDYKERVSYDANGNILKYLRQGYGANLAMDSLTYNYNYTGGRLANNKLNYVTDNVGTTTAYTDDIEDQAAGNYTYDEIGNLTSNAKDSISNIEWNMYGKIRKISRIASSVSPITSIQYKYDPAGNRILKAVTKGTSDSVEYTAYARDASGNVMATYFGKDAPNGSINSGAPLLLKEQHLYGSSRIGVLNRTVSIGTSTYANPSIVNFARGNKFFELSNHLGNVLATVSDKKLGVDINSDDVIDYYNADIITANDYTPGGSLMPGRKYSQVNSTYRYGFNGKENDNDVKGEGNQQDYGFRIYDPRLGRFLSVDPISKKYPELTPYQFASNRPIDGIDLDGKEWAQETTVSYDFSTTTLKTVTTNYIKVKVINQSTLVTGPAVVKTKAELYKQAVEQKFTNVQVPLATPENIIRTEVILDFTPPSANDLPSIGRLVFSDITTTKTVTVVTSGATTTTTTKTTSTEGFTKGEIQGFTINLGITRDGALVSDADFINTSQHETGHSGGLNHPWKLSGIEKIGIPEIDQNGLPGLIDINKLKTNLLNSFENPKPSLQATGTNLDNKQLEIMSKKIADKSSYTPDELKSPTKNN